MKTTTTTSNATAFGIDQATRTADTGSTQDQTVLHMSADLHAAFIDLFTSQSFHKTPRDLFEVVVRQGIKTLKKRAAKRAVKSDAAKVEKAIALLTAKGLMPVAADEDDDADDEQTDETAA